MERSINMAARVNMRAFGTSSANYVRYVINKPPRPLLTNVHRFIRMCHCRTDFSESSVRYVRYKHCVGRQTGLLFGINPFLQHSESAKFMSTEQKPSITEEILKSKLDEKVKTAGSDPDVKESKKSSDKSDSWFGGKNAWKLGLLSLTGMGILMCGNLLILWGELVFFLDNVVLTLFFVWQHVLLVTVLVLSRRTRCLELASRPTQRLRLH